MLPERKRKEEAKSAKAKAKGKKVKVKMEPGKEQLELRNNILLRRSAF